jgi:SNW domain-containing protein 1
MFCFYICRLCRCSASSTAPEYPNRKGWVPKSQADFGDGGAYPELLVAQYPLDMGRPGKVRDFFPGVHLAGSCVLFYAWFAGCQLQATSSAIVPVTLDTGSGKARFDAVITAQHNDKALVHTRFNDLAEKNSTSVVQPRPTEQEEIEAAARTRAALEEIVTTKISHARPGYVPTEAISRAEQSKYVRYTPAEDTNGYSEATSQRIIRMVEAPVDPFEPPKFRHKKVPGGPPDAPVPLMHSPPRKLTVADQQAWSVPVCVSNWKNARGYVVPLDKRLAADGRSLLEPTINDKFATFSESLLIAERKARVEVETRAAIERKLALKEKEEKESELRDLALKARLERTGVAPPAASRAAAAAHVVEELYEEVPASPAHSPPRTQEEGLGAPAAAGRAPGETAQEYAARQERELQRRERKRERERDLRMDNMTGKRARTMKEDEDRDVSEKIALGLAVGRGTAGGGAEAAFDSRLFNQSEGISTGLGDEDGEWWRLVFRTTVGARGTCVLLCSVQRLLQGVEVCSCW